MTFLYNRDLSFLNDGGEMGRLIRSYNWNESPLGPPETWPQSLRTSISIMLRSGYPIFVWWGKEMIMFNNDAYLPVLGNKHPQSLGACAKDCWSAIWDQVGPMMDQVLYKGEQIFAEDLLFLLDRKGFSEECYFTFSYSPIPNDDGGVGGIFCASNEETRKVFRQRRIKTLKEISDLSSSQQSLIQIYRDTMEVLARNPNDIPFSLLYILNENSNGVFLAGKIGFEKDHIAAPNTIPLTASEIIWPLGIVRSSNKSFIVQNLKQAIGNLPGGPWEESAEKAMILPIHKSGQGLVTGFLILGVSPKIEFDEEYQTYFELTARQTSAVISNIIALEEERKRAEALAEIDKAKTVFFSNISHEFRTPLTLMLGPLEELLNDPTYSSNDKNRIETAHRNALRLLKLVNNLLDYSRIEAGRVKAVFQQIDICDLTIDLSSSFRSIIENAGLQFNINCSKNYDPVFVDVSMWERIIFNLLSNSYKFTFKGEISLSLKENNGKIELRIKDTGTGIPEHEIQNLFSRFHRIENAKGRTHEGSGIGLAMVYELVKLHGGSIEVKSKLDQGTEFILTLPTGKDHLPSNQIYLNPKDKVSSLNAIPSIEDELGIYENHESEISRISHKSKKEKILLADDNSDMREYLVRLLGNDYDIKAVADGVQALKSIQEDKPALLLSDIMMPNLDGIGLLKQLRSDPTTNTIPVIFLSARAGEEAKIEGLEAGADDYLVKPFTSKELFARVQSNIAMSVHRKQTEDKIKAEREKLYEVLMQAPAMIGICRGPNLIYELANSMYLQVVGKTNEIIGKSVWEVFPEIKGQPIENILKGVKERGERFVGKEVLINLDSNNDGVPEELYFNFVYVPLRDSEGKIDGVLTHAIEVTDQVTARKQLEESEQRFRTMAEGTDVLIATSDETSNATYFNKAWLDMTGRTMDELINYGWADLIHEDDRQQFLDTYIASFNKQKSWTGEFRFLNKDGEYRWLLAKGPARFKSDGSFAGYISSCIDITAIKKAEKELVSKNTQLTKINTDLDNFIYTASHDLKAPMSNIEGLLSSLKESLQMREEVVSEESHIFIDLMEKSINRFKTTILDLTEITKVQKTMEEDIHEINLSQFVEDVKLSIYDKIIESNATIETDFSNKNTIPFSRKNFKSILYNLLSNAIKYRNTSRDCEIYIKTEDQEKNIVLIVRDNGLGISKKNQDKLFTMFKRFHDHVEGTGIGLYIVKRIIDNAGGRIEVDSDEGIGSTFKIYFPKYNYRP